jgi:biofilm protein TabA
MKDHGASLTGVTILLHLWSGEFNNAALPFLLMMAGIKSANAMNYKIILHAFALSVINISCYTQQQGISEKAITRWVNKKEWANGLTLDLHRSVDKDSFYMAYHRNKRLWDAAFAFLRDRNLEEINPGKYPIAGEQVFATITEGPSRKIEEIKWESHKNYIDLQYIIKGKELIGVADTSTATITKPYIVDVINYNADGKYYTAGQGKFFLFFSNNAHRPTIKIDGYDVVKKIVIKIQTAKAE